MELCAVNVRQDQEVSHKQPHGYHFCFHWTVCGEETKYEHPNTAFVKWQWSRRLLIYANNNNNKKIQSIHAQ